MIMIEFNYIIKIDNGSILYILYDNKSEWINIIWQKWINKIMEKKYGEHYSQKKKKNRTRSVACVSHILSRIHFYLKYL
jgi:hypothetical protein